MQLTIADAVVALIVLISALLAYNRGFTREVAAIGGWIVAGFAAFHLGPMVTPLILEIPGVGDFLSTSCTLSALAAFAAVFALALIVMSIFTPLLSSLIHASVLEPVDKGLGFGFGVARGALLVGVLYLGYDLIAPESERLAAIENSASNTLMQDVAAAIAYRAPDEAPAWLDRQINHLLGDCVA